MKRIFTLLAFSLTLIAAKAQSEQAANANQNSSYDLAVLTFEDADYDGKGNFLGKKDWSSLIDDTQYGGELLYGATAASYRWYDENNTGLSGNINDGDWGMAFYNGGTAISNYVTSDLTDLGLTQQLMAYNPQEGGKGGHNNSDNFLVCYGYYDGGQFSIDSRPTITFEEGAKVIDHAYICLSAYGLSSATYGDAFCPAATESDWLDITAEALDADGTPTGKTCTLRAMDGRDNMLADWQKWDLAELGECHAVRFNMNTSITNEWGICFPTYFLLDDIAVRVTNPSDPASVTTVSEAESAETQEVYNLNGMRITSISRPGIYIINGKKTLVK